MRGVVLDVSQGDAHCHSTGQHPRGGQTGTGTGRSPRLVSGFQGTTRTIGNITNSSKWFIKEMKPQQ